jgi:hypothetical protein
VGARMVENTVIENTPLKVSNKQGFVAQAQGFTANYSPAPNNVNLTSGRKPGAQHSEGRPGSRKASVNRNQGV